MTKSALLKKMPTNLPKMIVFDLDYTLWSEWIDCIAGPPYQYDEISNIIINPQGESLALFEHTTAIFALIKTTFPEIKIGIASRTGEPDWAGKALRLLRVPELGSTTLYDNIDFFEMYPGTKLRHFKSLTEKTGIACQEMLFFDDEGRNKEVTKLGVHFVRVDTRTGITPYQFENALHAYAKASGYKQSTVNDYFVRN